MRSLIRFLRCALKIQACTVLGGRPGPKDASVVIRVKRRGNARPRCPVHNCILGGTMGKTLQAWRHLDFAGCPVYLEAELRVGRCSQCDGRRREGVPWASHRALHTKAFDRWVAKLVQLTDKTAVSELSDISWHSVGRIVERVVADAGLDDPLDNLVGVTVDEVSHKRGHKYLTIVTDLVSVMLSQRGASAKMLVENHKCCVISPSRAAGIDWVPPGSIYESDGGQLEINRFSKSKDADMLCLVARYDGIDLPGDSCRVLILDRLPIGEALIDRFIDESVRVEAILTARCSTRIVQAIGRIFRSNTDHGVVLLVGTRLQAWLRSGTQKRSLPSLIQQQLLLASELSQQVEKGDTNWEDLIAGVLNGDPDWDKMYREYIEQFEVLPSQPETDWYAEVVLAERVAYTALWQGQAEKSLKKYSALVEKAEVNDQNLAAWVNHWRALASLVHGDRTGARSEFINSANMRSELGRPPEQGCTSLSLPLPKTIGSQAGQLSNFYRNSRHRIRGLIAQVRADLSYGKGTGKAEEALRLLGELLGLSTARPDHSIGVGPDVTWSGSGTPAMWGFELKTEKSDDGIFSKSDIGQCHNHAQWLEEQFANSSQLCLVGRFLPVSEQANPSSTLLVSELTAFHELTDRVELMTTAVEISDKANLDATYQKWLTYYGLDWPNCVEALEARLAVDLKSTNNR